MINNCILNSVDYFVNISIHILKKLRLIEKNAFLGSVTGTQSSFLIVRGLISQPKIIIELQYFTA
jgi:hypothetical protein